MSDNLGMGIGRVLIILGAALLLIGVLFSLGDRLSIRFGSLPGDIVYRGKNTVFYFPWVTCLVISVLLSLILGLFSRR